jgi:hypothetical protein
MNLAKHDQSPGVAFAGCAELLQEFLSILFDRGPRVLLSESKIQSPSSVDGGESACTRAEAVDEPGNRLERVSLENLELSFPGSLQRHQIILAMSVTSGTHGRLTNEGSLYRAMNLSCSRPEHIRRRHGWPGMTIVEDDGS